MASFCESELGYGHVAVQVVSRDNPAKSEEQYEVHVSDQFFFKTSIFAQTASFRPIPAAHKISEADTL